jgi:hypothetical protein
MVQFSWRMPPKKRQKGIPVPTLLAAFIDPRTKLLNGLGPEDVNSIHTEIKQRMRQIIIEARLKPNEEIRELDPAPVIGVHNRDALDDLFEKIGLPNELLPNNVEPNDPQDLDDEALDNFVNQEFFAYLKMPHLPMREHDNKGRLRYTDPLKWWCS